MTEKILSGKENEINIPAGKKPQARKITNGEKTERGKILVVKTGGEKTGEEKTKHRKGTSMSFD